MLTMGFTRSLDWRVAMLIEWSGPEEVRHQCAFAESTSPKS